MKQVQKQKKHPAQKNGPSTSHTGFSETDDKGWEKQFSEIGESFGKDIL